MIDERVMRHFPDFVEECHNGIQPGIDTPGVAADLRRFALFQGLPIDTQNALYERAEAFAQYIACDSGTALLEVLRAAL